MTYTKSGSFGWAGGGKSGATVDLWAVSRFSGFPAQDQAPPSGSPDAGPVETGSVDGNPGGFLLTGIATVQDYYVRVQYGGVSYWGGCPAGTLGGQTGGGGGGYDSLTGAGETATPGDLVQAGGLTVNDAEGHDIVLSSSGSGIVSISTVDAGTSTESSWVMQSDGSIVVLSEGPEDILLASIDGGDLQLLATPGSITVNGAKVGFYTATPVVQAAAITDPTGGSTIDTQARTAINAIIAALAGIGIIA